MQSEAGATFFDVCASVEEDVEVETLKWMIDLVQEVSDTPICIDSPSARRPEVEQYSDGTPVEGGYLDQICLGKGLFR